MKKVIKHRRNSETSSSKLLHPSTTLLRSCISERPELLQEMIRSIKEVGQQVPIIKINGTVFDGNIRMAACESLGIKPKFVEIDSEVVKSRRNAANVYVALNGVRRHLNDGERALLAAQCATLAGC
jgi:ParB-like chromosome segregation protein Spo0J